MEEKINNNQKGNIGESMIIASLLERGYKVLIPIDSKERYDLVIDDKKNGFIRIQCKHVKLSEKNTIKVPKKTKKGEYTSNEIDCFMIYEPSMKRIYMVDINDPVTKLRTKEPLKKNPSCKYAGNYLFHDFKNSIVRDGKQMNFKTKPKWTLDLNEQKGKDDFVIG